MKDSECCQTSLRRDVNLSPNDSREGAEGADTETISEEETLDTVIGLQNISS